MLRDPDGQAGVAPTVAPEPDVPENPNNIHGARGHDGRWFAAPSCDEANDAFVTEAPADGQLYARNGETGQWEPTAAGIATHTELGAVRVPARNKHNQGLDLDPVGGWLYAPPATHEHLGTLVEPPNDGKDYARTTDNGQSEWVEVTGGMEEPPMQPAQSWARSSGGVRGWLPIPNTRIAGRTEDELGVVYVPLERGLRVYSDGMLGLDEPPPDGELYSRVATMPNGLGQWQQSPGTKPAGENPAELGLIWVPKDQGLELEPSGKLTLNTATDTEIGGFKEVPDDDVTYARKRAQGVDVGDWVEVEGGGIEEPPANPVAIWGRTSAGARGWIALDQTGVVVAGDNPGQKGIVYIPDRGGISLYQDGRIELSPTAPGQIGGIVDAPFSADPNDPTSYVRQDGAWVVSAAGDKVYIAGDTPDRTGVVYVPDGGGISLYQDGKIELSPATPTQKGAFIDAPWDGKSYARKDAAWVEAVGSEFTTVGRSPTQALEEGFDPVLKMRSLWVPLATDTLAGAIVEPPNDGKPYVRQFDDMAGNGTWVPAAGSVSIGDTFPDIATVPDGALHWESDSGSLFVAYDDSDGDRQWVETGGGGDTKASIEIGDAPPANPTQGMFWWDSVTGKTSIFYDDGDSAAWVQIAPGPEGGGTAGGITEAPLDGLQYGRQNGLWTEVVTSHTTISDTPPVNPQIADLWFQGTTLDTFIYYDDGSGPIWVQQNTPADFTGYVTDAPVDGTPYSRQDAAWVPAIGAPPPPIATDTVLGLVMPALRGAANGINIDTLGVLSVPLATEALAGSIVEPPADGAPYIRTRTAAGVSSWAPSTSGVIVSDTAPVNPTQGMLWWDSTSGETYLWFEDVGGPPGQWVQQAPGTGGEPLPEAPVDGKQYARQDAAWSEVVAGMFIGDAPPANPIPGAQWFNSTTLNSFVFYEDPTSSQWIQFAPGAAPDLSSYATEAWVADQIANATIDAQAFVATALSNAPGHDTDLCQQALAAVTKLSATVDQLVKGHHSLKARIKALEARHA